MCSEKFYKQQHKQTQTYAHTQLYENETSKNINDIFFYLPFLHSYRNRICLYFLILIPHSLAEQIKIMSKAFVTKPAPDFKKVAVMPDGEFKELSLSDYKGE